MRHLSVRFVSEGEPVPRANRVYHGKIPPRELDLICQWATGRIPRFGRATKKLRIVVIGRRSEKVEEAEKGEG